MPFAPRDTLECRIALRFLMTTKSLQNYCFSAKYTNFIQLYTATTQKQCPNNLSSGLQTSISGTRTPPSAVGLAQTV